MMVTHRIALEPADHDRARMSRNGADLGTSRQPFFKAARLLLELGEAEPNDRIETWRGNTLCLGGPVWAAAKLTVKDNGAPVFARWMPFVRDRVDRP